LHDINTRGQCVVSVCQLPDCRTLRERLARVADLDEAVAWKRVAGALIAAVADDGADPLAPAVVAYNHARNGRWAEAIEWATDTTSTPESAS
jgi:hypothetical protein